MKISEISGNILSEIKNCFDNIPEAQIQNLADAIKSAHNIFCVGAGRSGIILRAFCMRLNHLGFNAFLAGEIPCPPASKSDLVIGVSGSGTTGSTVAILNKAHEAGARIVLLTATNPEKVSHITNELVNIHAPSSLEHDSASSHQLMKTLFEQTVFLTCEVLIEILCAGLNEQDIINRHTNLE